MVYVVGCVLVRPVIFAVAEFEDRKSTRLNSSHGYISYAVFCLKKKTVLPSNAGPRHSSLLPQIPVKASRPLGVLVDGAQLETHRIFSYRPRRPCLCHPSVPQTY